MTTPDDKKNLARENEPPSKRIPDGRPMRQSIKNPEYAQSPQRLAELVRAIANEPSQARPSSWQPDNERSQASWPDDAPRAATITPVGGVTVRPIVSIEGSPPSDEDSSPALPAAILPPSEPRAEHPRAERRLETERARRAIDTEPAEESADPPSPPIQSAPKRWPFVVGLAAVIVLAMILSRSRSQDEPAGVAASVASTAPAPPFPSPPPAASSVSSAAPIAFPSAVGPSPVAAPKSAAPLPSSASTQVQPKRPSPMQYTFE